MAVWTKTLGKHGEKIASVLKKKGFSWEDLVLLNDAHLEKWLDGAPLVKAQAAISALKGVQATGVPDRLQEPIILLASTDEDEKEAIAKLFSKDDFKQALTADGFVTVHKDGETPTRIFSWEVLVAASRDPDTVLVLGGGLSGKLSNLTNYRHNRDTGLERITTSCLVLDHGMVRHFSTLTAVNNGEAVVVYIKDEGKKGKKGNAFKEFDGLVLSEDVVFMNECKATLDPRHIFDADGVLERAKLLQTVIDSPDSYITDPSDVLGSLAGKRVIPVASTYKAGPSVRALCLNQGVVLVSRDGPGGSFIVTIPPSLLAGSR